MGVCVCVLFLPRFKVYNVNIFQRFYYTCYIILYYIFYCKQVHWDLHAVGPKIYAARVSYAADYAHRPMLHGFAAAA